MFHVDDFTVYSWTVPAVRISWIPRYSRVMYVHDTEQVCLGCQYGK
jgi:hypothetical protein